MPDSANTTSLSAKDLLNLAPRLRDRADDMRSAADLRSRWAHIRDGWE